MCLDHLYSCPKGDDPMSVRIDIRTRLDQGYHTVASSLRSKQEPQNGNDGDGKSHFGAPEPDQVQRRGYACEPDTTRPAKQNRGRKYCNAAVSPSRHFAVRKKKLGQQQREYA